MNVHLPVLMFADDLRHYHKCELSTESILRAVGCASLHCKGFHAALVIMQVNPFMPGDLLEKCCLEL